MHIEWDGEREQEGGERDFMCIGRDKANIRGTLQGTPMRMKRNPG